MNKSLLDYEDKHLKENCAEFRHLMQEFRDGMLCFEISNREVWQKALEDEAGLQAYFQAHASDYHWETPRYRGIVLHCASKRVGKRVRKLLKEIPAEEWSNGIRLVFNAEGKQQVRYEQGVFLMGDNAAVDVLAFKKKKREMPVDESYPFTTIFGKIEKGPASVEEVQGLGNTLLAEVCRSADDMWRRVYEGRLEVTHKALSPLRTLHEKLTGLSFVEPHVAPIADIIRSALDRMPARGTIGGTDLLLLQGVVCLLRDSRSLVEHARKIMAGQETVSILDSLLTINDMTRDSSDEAPQLQTDDADDAPLLPEIPSLSPGLSIPGMGLW